MVRAAFDWIFAIVCIALCLYLVVKGSRDLWDAFFFHRADDFWYPALLHILGAGVAWKVAERAAFDNAAWH